MLVIAEASHLLLLLSCPPEQFHHGFGLEIFLASLRVAAPKVQAAARSQHSRLS
jgi:hypothetical protein